ncbi:MAG: hypoxanthine phosphoribosyltransferase [Chlorobi bacterium]|nr:hypoxanthine phosphoribosyltransferase [Chlorobiota bacterium]MCI0714948.1 hypoxanthine phosphoribosyltransferase [Chlorobiota bacterium]
MKLQQKEKLKLFVSSRLIQKKVRKIAKKISRDYKNKVPILIGVLNGSFIFISDLVRELKIDIEIDFLKLSSYGDSKISSGEVILLKDLNCQIEGRNVIVVDDIIDSGLSVKYIRDLIISRKPASLEFVSLLLKDDVNNLDFDIKYVGFKIPNKFVVGYGLDYAQKFRNLKQIYILKH